MVDFIIILFLLIGLLVGMQRGFILQIIHLAGFVLSYVLAYLYFDNLAPKLKLWIPYPTSIQHNSFFSMLGHIDLQTVYYRAIAFGLIFIGTKIAIHIIGSMLDFLADLPLLSTINKGLGGILGFIETYLLIFILLYLAAIMPFFGIENAVSHSHLAHLIIEKTPVFSQDIKNLWVNHSS